MQHLKFSISRNQKSISLTLVILAIGFIVVFGGRMWSPLMRSSVGAQAAQRPVRVGADEGTKVSRDPSKTLWQISIRSEKDRQVARGLGTVIEDYGSLMVVALSQGEAGRAEKLKTLDLARLETTIEIRDFRFDPLVEDPAQGYASAGGYREVGAAEGDYYIVQFAAPARDEWLEEVIAAGGRVLQYLPHQAFFVYASADGIAKISQHPRVRWAGAFHPIYKVPAELRWSADGRRSKEQQNKGGEVKQPDGYDIAVFKQENLGEMRARVTALGADIRHQIDLPNNYFNVLRVGLDPSAVKQIAQLPGVIAIDPYYKPSREDERAAQIVAGNFTSVTALNPPGYNSLTQFGVDGTNVTVAVVDDGVGIPGDCGLYITAANAVNGPLRGATTGALGHGHLNATIIGGDTPFGTLDPLGYNYGLGVARKSHIINIPLLRTGYTGTEADTANDTVATAGPNGVFGFISNNSWGAGTNGNVYDSLAAQFDGFTRDASAAGTIDPLLVIFSAGNSGTLGLTRPKVAKNIIAVANSENIRTELSPSANNLDEMTVSSSRGLAFDGRVKPDISAPGTVVSGGRSGTDALGGNIDTCHRWSTGTSHAAPQIAGAAALFTQFWKNGNGGANPSPALVKAALINGAQEMAGTGATTALPNGDEGWGRLNLKNVLNTGIATKYVNQTVALSSVGETQIYTGTVASAARHVRISLVWTDPPAVSDPALVNNLDLEVTVGGTLYKGNYFAGGLSIAGGSADSRNNVENIFLPVGIPAGTPVSIRIRATALNGDGVLGNADITDQHFALVAFNFSDAPAAILAVTDATITAESCAPAGNAIDPNETVTVDFALQNVGSLATTNVVATLLATGGVTSPSGSQNYGALAAGGAAVSRPFTFTANGACGGTLTATLSLQDGATSLGTATFTFTLGSLISSTFSYTGPPVAIPDGNTTGVNIPLAISGFSGNIADLNFRIDGTTCDAAIGSTTVGVNHTWVSDLVFKLTSPGGTTVTFINQPGGFNNSGNNLCQVLLDDDANATSISVIAPAGSPPIGPPYTGTFRPQSPLSAFDGQSANGTWTLNVSDLVGVDSGSVRAFSLIISRNICCSGSCPAITVSPAPPSGQVGVNYSHQFTASGGAAPYSYDVSAGSLPPGLTLSTGGALSGIPTQQGSFPLTVRATDANGCQGTLAVTLSIAFGCLPITVNPPTIPNGAVGVPYSQMFSATGGTGPYTFVVSAGTLPPGLSLSSGGALTGTPAQAGPFNFTVQATDSLGCQGTRPYPISIGPAPPAGAWGAQTSGVTNDLQAIHTINGSDVWAAGVNATLLHSLNGGANWAPVSTGVAAANGFNSVEFFDANNGIVAGNLVLSRTTNGGASWVNNIFTSATRNRFDPITISSIWAAGFGGQAGCRSHFQYTLGASGFISSSFTNNACPGSAQNDVHFINADNGWSAGVGGVIARTTNGTAPFPDFTTQSSGTTQTLRGIFMLDLNTGWIVGAGGTILKTTNGGANWSPKPSGVTSQLNEVHFVDANLGWAVGNGGVILVSTDGGETWTTDPSGVTADLRGLYFINSSVGYAVGTSGTILKRATCTGPTIDAHPLPQTVCAGSPVTFSVSASGPGPITYQWQKNGVDLPGATNPSYSIPSVVPSDAGSYTVKVTNSCTTVTSNTATLTVNTPPAIIVPPAGQNVCAGQPASFTVTASGTAPLNFQWRKNGVPIQGATGPTFSIPATVVGDSGLYDVLISNSCGSAISPPAPLSVDAPPVITDQPDPQNVCVGQPASFSVVATGAGPISYQWRKNGAPISGAISPTFTIQSAVAGDVGSYDVVATNFCGSVTSSAAALTVNAGTSIVSHPADQTVCAGQSASFSVTPGGVGPFTYQWRKNGINIPGGTGNPYQIPSTTPGDAGNYDVVVTGSCGVATSNQATLTINLGPTITSQPSSQTVCEGQSIAFSITATGTPSLTYQWRKSGVPIAGATASSLSFPSPVMGDSGTYDVVVSNSCGSVTSSPVTLTVNKAPMITTQPVSLERCPEQPATFTVTAAGVGLSYQWRKQGVNISGATSPTYTIPSVSDGDAAFYDVVVSNACGSIESNAAALTINSRPSITAQPQSLTRCVGESATFSVTATGTGLTYQWKKNGADIAGATNPTFTIPSVSASDAASYDVVVLGTCSPGITSLPVTLTVNPLTAIITQPVSITRQFGQSATFTVTANGANLTYQWRKNGASISGATSAVYTIPAVGFSDQGNYSVVVAGTCGTVTSADASLSVTCQPITVNPPSLPNAQIGQPYNETITQTGGVGAVNFTLSMGSLPNGLSLSSGGVISGTPTVSGQFAIKVRATDSNSCFGERDYTLHVGVCPVITITPSTLPSGNVGTLYSQNLTATGGTPPRTFSLSMGSLPAGLSLSTGGVISGTPAAAGSFTFKVKATDSAGCFGEQQYTIVICSTIAISPPGLPPGFTGVAYNQTLTQVGGVGAITWSMMSGALPVGLSLSTGGVISGVPSQVGVFDFVVKATDVNGCMGTRNYRIVISGNGLMYYPLSKPIRLLDTRSGESACNDPGTPLTGGIALTLPARGVCQGETIPSGAKAIVGNATVVNTVTGSGGGFITLYPSDADRPEVSNLNFLPSQIIPNAFTVGLGNVDGAFKIYASPGTSPHFIVDVTGYFAPPSTTGLFYHPLPRPIRLLDTRTGATGCTTPGVPLVGGQSLTQNAELTCDGVTIPANAQAIVGNGTVVNFQSGGGFITLYPDGAMQPTVSNMNYSANQIIPNAFTVGLGPSGAFKIFASAATDFIVDVTGYYSNDPGPDVNGVSGLLFNPLSKPIRLLDTRPGATACETPGTPLAEGSTRRQLARRTCQGETIPTEAQAVIGNATVVNFISAGGFITLWPEGAAQPTVSNLNYQANQIIPNAFTVGLGSNGEFNIFASAATHFITDLTGYFSP